MYVSEAKADQHIGNLAYPGDVLVTQRGTVGQVGLIPDKAPFERYLLSQSQMKLTVDPSRAERRFVYYWLCSPEAQHAMYSSTISAGVPHINLATFKALKIGLPPLDVQAHVAGILGSLDDLIDNNRRRVEVLEEMARAIYREWFVHFRYPGHESATLVDSPVGPIPDGWELMAASKAMAINPRVKLDRSAQHPFITMGDLSDRGMACFPSEEKVGNSGAKFVNGDTLFARITPCLENGKTGFVQRLEEGQAGRGSTEFVVLRGIAVGAAYTYCLARSEAFRAHAIQSMSGASGRQRVRNECFNSFLLPVPPLAFVTEFERLAAPLFKTVCSLSVQATTLAAVRDLLLPKLVTGQIDVSSLDLDALVEESVV